MLKTRFGNTPYTLIFLQADQAADRGLNAKRTSSGGSHAVLRAQPFSPPCLFVIFVLLLHEAKLTKKKYLARYLSGGCVERYCRLLVRDYWVCPLFPLPSLS